MLHLRVKWFLKLFFYPNELNWKYYDPRSNMELIIIISRILGLKTRKILDLSLIFRPLKFTL